MGYSPRMDGEYIIVPEVKELKGYFIENCLDNISLKEFDKNKQIFHFLVMVGNNISFEIEIGVKSHSVSLYEILQSKHVLCVFEKYPFSNLDDAKKMDICTY